MRVRGLKQKSTILLNCVLMSHPVRVRGLKQFEQEQGQKALVVAPRAGAWIETLKGGKS